MAITSIKTDGVDKMNVIDLLVIIISVLMIIYSIRKSVVFFKCRKPSQKEIKAIEFYESMLNYRSLTKKSKKMADGYIQARMINDERTTYSTKRGD